MADLSRLDSALIFSLANDDPGANLLPFDDIADLLDIDLPLPVVETKPPPPHHLGAPAGPADGAIPSTSGGSDHTRAMGWTSNPSSDGDGDGSGGSDADGIDGSANGRSTGRGGKGGKGSKASGAMGVKKRRQRNEQQMESNRLAQQKYRQRKKGEQSALQQAVDMLTAQVAALKAVEVRNVELQAALQRQDVTVSELQQRNVAQAQELDATRASLASSQRQVVAQHKLILDQQAKLRLQEEVIASLKDRLKERIDEAMQSVVPGSVCEKMVAAVKATLYGAKDVHGLQETLAQLPEHLVYEICRNIFEVVKNCFPELRQRCMQLAGANATQCMGTA